MGNHEELLLSAIEEPSEFALWLDNGGGATLQSYGAAAVADLPVDDIEWIQNLPLCHDDGLRFFVHAGIDLARPLDRQRPQTLLWMREPFLTDCDFVDCGRFIVHGHTPLVAGTPDLRRRRVNLDTAAVIGGPLSAAVFDDTPAEPPGFLTDGEDG